MEGSIIACVLANCFPSRWVLSFLFSFYITCYHDLLWNGSIHLRTKLSSFILNMRSYQKIIIIIKMCVTRNEAILSVLLYSFITKKAYIIVKKEAKGKREIQIIYNKKKNPQSIYTNLKGGYPSFFWNMPANERALFDSQLSLIVHGRPRSPTRLSYRNSCPVFHFTVTPRGLLSCAHK